MKKTEQIEILLFQLNARDKEIESIIEKYIHEIFKEFTIYFTVTNNQNIAKNFIEKNEPSIFITDTFINQTNSISNILNNQIKTRIISIVESKEQAIQSFRNKAFDCIILPIEENEIVQIFQRLLREFSRIFENQKKETKNYIILNGNNKKVKINYNEILYAEAMGSYTKIVTNISTFTIAKTLKKIQSILPINFVRIHRSYLVSLNNINSYNHSSLILHTGEKILISKKGKSILTNQGIIIS